MKTVVLTAMLALLTGAFSGCDKKNKGKSRYDMEIEMICFAEQKAGVEGITDPSERMVKIANYLRTNLKDEKAISLMRSFASMAPESRSQRLREEAKKAGLASCPMADDPGGQ